MRRNAVVLWQRGQHLSSAISRASLIPVTTRRLLETSIQATTSLRRPVTLLSRTSGLRSDHAADKNTSIGRPRLPTALQVGRIGLRQSLWKSSQDWQESKSRLSGGALQRRWKSDVKKAVDQSSVVRNAHEQLSKENKDSQTQATEVGGAGKYIYDHLPHFHRPTKEELLAAANGFWHRLQIRFKWFSIRSVRPFNHEEIFAFLSWIFWGHLLWLVIGTTTFVSLGIWALNTVFAQETLASWVGNYLTKSTGIQVVFESAIVPKWGEGTIRLNKVFVSRRPAANKGQRTVTKGSSVIAAAAAAASAQAGREHIALPVEANPEPDDDGNYSQFDVTIENVDLTLSFRKWFNGKGLLQDVGVRGVRGVVDRTHVKPRPEDVGRDPKSYRHEHNIGDFEIEHFKMEDVLITMYQPNNFRPFTVSVYNCELPRLRKQWLFYDFLCANNMSGSFDGSLFTIHPRQVHSTSGALLVDGQEEFASTWKKHSRIRVDGLKIDHLNRGVEGPFSWIVDGNVDIVSDIMIPNDADGSIAKVMSDFYDRMEATVTNQIAHNGHASPPHIHHGSINNEAMSLDQMQERQKEDDDENRFLVMDIQIHLNDVRASVPIFTRDISYVNNAVVRPIVAYINSHSRSGRNFIPITCRIVKRQSEFDGSWTVFDSGLLEDLSRETYDAFVRDISDRKARQRRMKKVGLWAAQVAAQALFIGLAGQLA